MSKPNPEPSFDSNQCLHQGGVVDGGDGDDDVHYYDAVIVGGGIAGLATALGFVERGVTNIAVIEKATKFQKVGASIALFQNGLRALTYLSPTVASRVLDSCIPVTKHYVKDGSTGRTIKIKDMAKKTVAF